MVVLTANSNGESALEILGTAFYMDVLIRDLVMQG